MSDDWMYGKRITATFQPKDVTTLRPVMQPYIGQRLELDWCGTGGDDEQFPGQHRWMTLREFEDRVNMDTEARARWIPDEDLIDAEPLPRIP
jgi:hypothetical protein